MYTHPDERTVLSPGLTNVADIFQSPGEGSKASLPVINEQELISRERKTDRELLLRSTPGNQARTAENRKKKNRIFRPEDLGPGY